MTSVSPAHAVILARLRIALRRRTGLTHDVDTLLAADAAAGARIAHWRSLGGAELGHLLDQHEALLHGLAPAGGPGRIDAAAPVTADAGPGAPAFDDSAPGELFDDSGYRLARRVSAQAPAAAAEAPRYLRGAR